MSTKVGLALRSRFPPALWLHSLSTGEAYLASQCWRTVL